MGKVTILSETTKHPLSLIGKMAGTCWGANTDDWEKNTRRGWDCIKSRHGRTWEFVEVYMVLEHWSARVIREFYTHIGGAPTRLQESTRYVDCTDFKFVTPPKIKNNEHPAAQKIYEETMNTIADAVTDLEELGIPREDAGMLLPLGMETKIVVRMNLRTLVDMAHQRLCARAYWEYRDLMKQIRECLSDYSVEWEPIITELFKPKCEDCGFCREKHSCGRKPTYEELYSKIYDTQSLSDVLKIITQNFHLLTEEQKEEICSLMSGSKSDN